MNEFFIIIGTIVIGLLLLPWIFKYWEWVRYFHWEK